MSTFTRQALPFTVIQGVSVADETPDFEVSTTGVMRLNAVANFNTNVCISGTTRHVGTLDVTGDTSVSVLAVGGALTGQAATFSGAVIASGTGTFTSTTTFSGLAMILDAVASIVMSVVSTAATISAAINIWNWVRVVKTDGTVFWLAARTSNQ